MKLSVSNFRIDPPDTKIQRCYHAMINIEAKLSITDSIGLYFEEEFFTVVELAAQLKKWLKSKRSTFIFESMDDDIEELLVFKPYNNGWLIYTSLENRPFSELLTNSEINEIAEKYISDVKLGVKKHLNIDLEKLCT